MEQRHAANGYVLTTSLLVAAYVRHHEDDDYEKQHAETSVLSVDCALERRTIARDSVNALASFLLHEIQCPSDAIAASTSSSGRRSAEKDPTTLTAVFQRLQRALPRPEDASVLVDEVLQVLASVDSPDAVGDVVDAIGECVAPLSQSANGDTVDALGDAANALLVRKSVFGVFVRRFVLGVNRLLFDGLSRVFDEVTRYREEYADRQTVLRRRNGASADGGAGAGAATTQSDISLSLTASPSSRFLWKHGDALDDLPLSPIVGATSTSVAEPKEFASLTLQTNDDSGGAPNGRKAVVPDAPSPAMNSLSRDQMQYYLHDVVQNLERGLTLPPASSSSSLPTTGTNSTTTTYTTTTQHILQPLQQSMDPDALFVTYLDAVNRRDYEAALESLHQYHDVSLSRTQRFRHHLRTKNRAAAAAAAAATSTGDGATATGALSSSGLHFLGSGVQYAALNLAGLHMAFDRFAAAQDSIQEAIRVAQHHGDHLCVAFALSWFVRVQIVQGKSRHHVSALIASALERAEELSLPSLRTLVSLTALEYDLSLGGVASDATQSVRSNYAAITRFPSPRPLDLWSRLNEVDHVLIDLSDSVSEAFMGSSTTGRTLGNLMNMQQQQQQLLQGGSAAVSARSDRTKRNGMNWKHAVESVLHMMWSLQGKSRTVAAIGWQLYGARALSESLDTVFWAAYRQTASSSEIASWISRVVIARLEGGPEDDDSDATTPSDSAASSQYVGALLTMRGALRQPELQRHQLLRREKTLQRTIQYLLAVWSLNRAEYALANAHISQLLSLSPSVSDFPARVEALVLQARLWGESEQFLQCFRLLDELETSCQDRGYEYLFAQILVLKSEFLRRSRAQHSPFDALPSVLQATEICRANRYDVLLAEAHVVVAEIHLAMGKVHEALDLLDQQMPLVMEHGSVQLRAGSLLVLAKASLACMASSSSSSSSPQSALEMDRETDKVLAWLHDSAALYRRLENWKQLREIAFLQTVLLRNQPAKGDAPETARSFLYYEKLLRLASQSSSAVPVTSVDSVSVLDCIMQARGLSMAL